jgi:hypothetical protein
MAMTPEGRIKTAVKRWLVERGIWYFLPVSNGMGRHGIPDIICCYQGRFLGLEIKAPGKRRTVTPNQIRELRAIKQAGGIALIVDDLQILEQALGASNDCLTETPGLGATPAPTDASAEPNPRVQAAPAQRRGAYCRAPQDAGVPAAA